MALLCAPGTWVRTPLPNSAPRDVAVTRLQGPGPTGTPGWDIAGVWEYDAESLMFGGYSALLALSGDRLRAFTDRAFRMTLIAPDAQDPQELIDRQLVARADANDLWDIESATRDPATGRYWLGYENHHTIHRFTREGIVDGKRDLTGEVDWGDNGGAEAMTRLADGRFVVLPEGGRKGVIFADDPVEGAPMQRFAFRNPAPGFAATDMAQLPDGRLIVLMRDVIWAFPTFTSLIAIGPPPVAGGVFAPETVLQLDPAIPRENYEGLALRPRADGRIDVWLISDDNLSVIQRTLLVKLVFDPAA
ncbi:esterase-like activity of phytase family protein [Porphyrobacter sp. YT40]|uniref:esterase-like activity of phytase family protein n=1 Tax=Porphyrobacter sp. YT40 TaxID=2547601 RepID=UPI001141E682|nr:esterase-like activity of phytase family protein [Porphyrobacter sp. YT40]QDH33312.1 esterase-like activity of phytase family protein [Porphyrobacter sp. YT40]